jgi:hypothetical protein
MPLVADSDNGRKSSCTPRLALRIFLFRERACISRHARYTRVETLAAFDIGASATVPLGVNRL